MKSRITLGMVLLLMISAPLSAQTPVGTAFTYQGQLKFAGTPVNDTADFVFMLYGTESGGTAVAGPITVTNVSVVNGLFATKVDFGNNAFNDEARWLEIAVRSPAGSGSYTTLNQRQALTAAPYALKVPGIDGHSLDAADGSPVDAIFVDQFGNVGIGTTTPGCRLEIESATHPTVVYVQGTTNDTNVAFYGRSYSTMGFGVIGSAAAPTGSTCGVYGQSWGTDGKGVWGEAVSTSGENCGVRGETNSAEGYAAYFTGPAGSRNYFERNVGIGTTSPSYPLHVEATDGSAVYGRTTKSTGLVSGVVGQSDSGAGWGVHGVATAADGFGWGVVGESFGTGGRGVTGWARATSGITCGVFGQSDSPDGYGIAGRVTATGGSAVGVWGRCANENGRGVHGEAEATSGSACGVLGETKSSGGRGVRGLAWTNGGIAGYFENASGNTAPALQTIGDAVIQGRNWPAAGVECRLQLGDGNHYIKSVAGQGVRIGTFGGVDLVRLQEGVGLVGIGRTPTANKLEVEGEASKITAGGWESNSDARIKTDVQTVANALDTLDKVRLVSFRYTDEYRCEHPGIADRQYVNVIAQEFAEVFPDYVQASGERLPDGGEILQVDPYPLTVYSAAAVQELHTMVKEKDAQIAALQTEIAALQEQDTRLAARVAALEQLVEKLAK